MSTNSRTCSRESGSLSLGLLASRADFGFHLRLVGRRLFGGNGRRRAACAARVATTTSEGQAEEAQDAHEDQSSHDSCSLGNQEMSNGNEPRGPGPQGSEYHEVRQVPSNARDSCNRDTRARGFGSTWRSLREKNRCQGRERAPVSLKEIGVSSIFPCSHRLQIVVGQARRPQGGPDNVCVVWVAKRQEAKINLPTTLSTLSRPDPRPRSGPDNGTRNRCQFYSVPIGYRSSSVRPAVRMRLRWVPDLRSCCRGQGH